MVLGGLLPGTPVVYVAVVLAATGVIWVGSGWLEASAERLAAAYGLLGAYGLFPAWIVAETVGLTGLFKGV